VRDNNINDNPQNVDQEFLEMTKSQESNGTPQTGGMILRRLTGDSTPYSFPATPIRLVQPKVESRSFFFLVRLFLLASILHTNTHTNFLSAPTATVLTGRTGALTGTSEECRPTLSTPTSS
jgi:hypothetical protein